MKKGMEILNHCVGECQGARAVSLQPQIFAGEIDDISLFILPSQSVKARSVEQLIYASKAI